MVNVSKAMKSAAKPLAAEIKLLEARILAAETEIGRLRTIIRVNLLRLGGPDADAEIERLIGD